MAEERSQRRLAAILAADVVGYSRLVDQDEAGTLASLSQRRRSILEPLVAEHHGRIVKLMGDGVLVEFASAVNAVTCATELQKRMAVANTGVAEDRHIVLRIGINLGDVIVEGGDLYGDGVIIASRLEAIAEPGGVLVSGTAYDQVKNKVKVGFDDLGAQTLKNIAEPARAYRVAGTPRVFLAAPKVAIDKPSIALLPFINMSGDPEHYFADSITENVIAGLSRFRDLFVIASNSTFAYKGKATKIQDVSRELGVRYILEGSVQRSKERVRITAQLIDGTTGRHLWVERYDRRVEDILVLQDEVSERIIGTLATTYGGRLLKAWQERPEATGTRDFQALDYFARGMNFMNRFTKDDNLRAREFFDKAARLEPNFGKAYAAVAWTHMVDAAEGWSEDPPTSLAIGLKFATLAIERDDTEAWGRYALAGNCLLRGQHDRALAEFERALELNPNDADVLTDLATA